MLPDQHQQAPEIDAARQHATATDTEPLQPQSSVFRSNDSGRDSVTGNMASQHASTADTEPLQPPTSAFWDGGSRAAAEAAVPAAPEPPALSRADSGQLLQQLLRERSTSASTLGVIFEAGDSGSLHMTLSTELLREALRKPLPSAASQQLLEPLWDSVSGGRLPNDTSSNSCNGTCRPCHVVLHLQWARDTFCKQPSFSYRPHQAWPFFSGCLTI
jgi:hypothetical protein